MGSLSLWHWAIVVVVFVLLFGANRLPDAARSLGKSLRVFKSEVRELQNDTQQATSNTSVQSERVEPPADPRSA